MRRDDHDVDDVTWLLQRVASGEDLIGCILLADGQEPRDARVSEGALLLARWLLKPGSAAAAQVIVGALALDRVLAGQVIPEQPERARISQLTGDAVPMRAWDASAAIDWSKFESAAPTGDAAGVGAAGFPPPASAPAPHAEMLPASALGQVPPGPLFVGRWLGGDLLLSGPGVMLRLDGASRAALRAVLEQEAA